MSHEIFSDLESLKLAIKKMEGYHPPSLDFKNILENTLTQLLS